MKKSNLTVFNRFPIHKQSSRSIRNILLAALFIIGFLLLLDWTAEYLWFEALGYTSVFLLIWVLKLSLFLGTFVLAFVYFWVNLRLLFAHVDLSSMIAAPLSRPPQPSSADSTSRQPLPISSRGLAALIAGVIALLFGLALAKQWNTLLRFQWSQTYAEVDPIYARDIGFYLFQLPLLELTQNTLAAVIFVALLLLVTAYFWADALSINWSKGLQAASRIHRHITVNLALYLLVLAWGYYLDRYALLQSPEGAVYGAGYTDVYITRPALWIAAGATAALAVAMLLPTVFVSGSRTTTLLAAYLAILFIGLGLSPWAMQNFRVEPNELELEQPFLRHNIAFTRKAYGLDRIDERFYRALDGLTPAALARNQSTIDNIRLWDWRPLSQTFRQLQQIRTYYTFGDVDVDRYQLGEDYRQVMLAARELSNELPDKADTWLNRYLQYTHGYGFAMSLTAEKDPQGNPVLIVKDLPPRGDISIAQPAIYYSEGVEDYRIVSTSVPEFDYPRGDENVYTHYQGQGGIRLDSFWKRLLFAWDQGDFNIFITAYTTIDSRIQLWRSVQKRVARLAPFLRLDNDPYPVISAGRLYWIQDAYTVSKEFPYSEPYDQRFNYIRNSVKIIIDAYDGTVDFYTIDPEDPVLAVYRHALPAMFKDLAQMPEDLRRHLRYPQDLFAAQVSKYSTYHMMVPQVFYNGEDTWSAPREKYGGEVISMKPYYILMKLPQEERLQFLLMTPLTPSKRDNMIAWVAARCDFPAYGELLVYKLPKERLILGPIQVEAMIDQDTLISQQLSLWDQRGSRVIRGNLLVIPIEQAFIYVEPVYLIAEDSDIPQLKRVIVSNGEQLAMEPTLEQALEVVFGERQPIPSGSEGAAQMAAARAALKSAEQALREGDWDRFGRAMQGLKVLLAE